VKKYDHGICMLCHGCACCIEKEIKISDLEDEIESLKKENEKLATGFMDCNRWEGQARAMRLINQELNREIADLKKENEKLAAALDMI
jgi:predicted RNase H-like nuclease (RuvC/YqgF family)